MEDEEEKARRVQELYREALDLAEQGNKIIFYLFILLSEKLVKKTKS